MLQNILYEVKKISFIIMMACGIMYLVSGLILQSPSWKQLAHMASFLHAFVYFPTFLFLSIFITLSASLHVYASQKNSTHSLPALITGGMIGGLSLLLMIYLSFL